MSDMETKKLNEQQLKNVSGGSGYEMPEQDRDYYLERKFNLEAHVNLPIYVASGSILQDAASEADKTGEI